MHISNYYKVYLKYTVCLFIHFCNSIESNSQEYIYQNFGVDDGLPSSEVYDIYQDKEGYIWFATDKGLSRYNGYEFENFDTSDGLTGNVVLRFYPQSNGQIWCYTLHDRSLFYFDEKFSGFKQYKFNEILKKLTSKGSIIKSVNLDEKNELHIGGHRINGEIIISDDGVVRNRFSMQNYFSDTTNTKKLILQPMPDAFLNPFFCTVLETNNENNHYLQTNYKTSRIMVSWLEENETAIFMTNQAVELKSSTKERIIKSEHSPIGIKVIDKEHFFIGYLFGGAKFVDKNGLILKEFLNGESVTSFLVDHEGGYWFTTLNSGVFYIANPTSQIYLSTKTTHHHINSMVKTKNDELLIGYKNGIISKLSRNRELLDFEHPKKTIHAHVEYCSELDQTYFSNNNEIRVNFDGKTLTNEYIIKFSEPVDKTIFGSAPGFFFSIDENNRVTEFNSPHRVHDICLWNNDTLFATPLGVFKFQNNESISLSNKSKFYEFRCDDIDLSEKKDKLYVATQGAGVVIDDGEQVFNITENDGLKSNVINEIYVENSSSFWVCTNRGINRVIWDENGISISGMSKKDGLLSNEVEDIEIINDTVWVGTKQGLCSFPKNQLNQIKKDVPFIKLIDVIVNNVAWEEECSLNLSYEANEIDFVLEGISYRNQEDLYYKYRLNKNSNWSITQNRKVQFSSLSPGNYFFEAKACVDDQNCSEKVLRYEFTVLAPFWKRWWFALLFLSGFGLLIYSFFKIRVLTYNKDMTREFIRLLIRRLKKEEKYFSFREDGKDIRIKTHEIAYIKSSGNYIDVHADNKTHTVRMNIGKFLENVPDKLEYIRIHRSYIVRIDKITSKSRNEVQLSNGIKVPVSLNHHKKLKEVLF